MAAPASATKNHFNHGSKIDAIKIGSATAAVRSRVSPELFVGAGLLGLFNRVGLWFWVVGLGSLLLNLYLDQPDKSRRPKTKDLQFIYY